MFKLIAKVLEILENDFTKGEIELTSFTIEQEHKDKLKKIENTKFFKKYKITFQNNGFRIEAIPLKTTLETSLLLFDRMKELFNPINVESGIGCGDGIFVFTFKNDKENNTQ